MKKLQIWWPFWFSLTLSFGMWVGYSLKKKIPDSQGFFDRPRQTPVQEVFELLKNYYVDPVHLDTLSDLAIQAMLEKLDPHTVYVPAEETQEANEELQGNFEGIGVEYSILQDTVHVIRILPDGPSAKAGLQSGDKFLTVESTRVAGTGISNEQIKKLLRGESGSQVQVTIDREGKSLTKSITRGKIPKPAVDASFLIGDEIGFVHLNKFSQTSHQELRSSLEALKTQGMKKLILDLRGNGGGLLEQAVSIADEFLDDDRLVVYTEGLHTSRIDYSAQQPGIFESGELIVLIDEFSASAAEVLAGALQDWDRATLLGRRTFGKGLVQEVFDLTNGAQIRLTVARYFTPSGRNIQKPFLQDHQSYNEEIYERYHNANTSTEDSLAAQGPAFKTLVKKRNVYGRGGIQPDIQMPRDSVRLSAAFQEQILRSSINTYIYLFSVREKERLRLFANLEDFRKKFIFSAQDEQNFLKTLHTGSARPVLQSPAERNWLNHYMVTNLALQIWGNEGYYKIQNTKDPVVQKALSLLRTK